MLPFGVPDPTLRTKQRHMWGGREGGEDGQRQFLIILKSIFPIPVKGAYPLGGSRTSHLGQTQS